MEDGHNAKEMDEFDDTEVAEHLMKVMGLGETYVLDMPNESRTALIGSLFQRAPAEGEQVRAATSAKEEMSTWSRVRVEMTVLDALYQRAYNNVHLLSEFRDLGISKDNGSFEYNGESYGCVDWCISHNRWPVDASSGGSTAESRTEDLNTHDAITSCKEYTAIEPKKLAVWGVASPNRIFVRNRNRVLQKCFRSQLRDYHGDAGSLFPPPHPTYRTHPPPHPAPSRPAFQLPSHFGRSLRFTRDYFPFRWLALQRRVGRAIRLRDVH